MVIKEFYSEKIKISKNQNFGKIAKKKKKNPNFVSWTILKTFRWSEKKKKKRKISSK